LISREWHNRNAKSNNSGYNFIKNDQIYIQNDNRLTVYISSYFDCQFEVNILKVSTLILELLKKKLNIRTEI
jgi:hypothetical protein